MDKRPLIDNDYLLQKFNGKGAWTYVLFPEIPKEKRFPFGWMKVSGSIDGFQLENVTLMPFGNGQLFLPVKAAIRKAIKKEVGEWVKVILFTDEIPEIIPDDILECLQDAPKAYQRFKSLSDSQQKEEINAILDSKKQDIKVEKIVKLIERLNY
ncbi:YdeI/OmpD-associated family protein [Aquiflexum gelatinilyticum]|uniref:YdeI/OmpD-associated family protein n=1 Tax=Aquiflexum gelatinilyticum TaxID=2961943 RepID=A0A9X2P729_9BACT|nr:YdeI/OmpD-associated family protein [Aquiflexum gelatinilyticum]MCR9015523.1 YdeI/OmpD-associated family protein [Aquiflexum gelatinilyticum]